MQEIEFLEQNNNKIKKILTDKKLVHLKLIYLFFLTIFSIIISSLISILKHNNNFILGALIHIPFLFLCLLLEHFQFNFFLRESMFIKKTWKLYAIFTIFNIVKYIVLFLGLIIGIWMNFIFSNEIFSRYSISICSFIYPASTFFSLMHCLLFNKNDKKI